MGEDPGRERLRSLPRVAADPCGDPHRCSLTPSERGGSGRPLCYHAPMKIRLLAFASAGDALGATETEIELPEGSRVADLRARLDRDHPALSSLWPRLAIAVDGRISGPDEPLQDGIEVALLPPVSGGSGLAELVDGPIDVDRAVRSVEAPGFGAVVVFLGTVRNHHAGRAVEKLTYSAYRRMAADTLAKIVAELEVPKTDQIPTRVSIVHR